MWFLEIYFKDGSQSLFYRKYWGDVADLRDEFILQCGYEIDRCVDYFSQGSFEGSKIITYP